MKPHRRLTLGAGSVLLVGLLAEAGAALAQDLHPSRRPSPMGMARINLGDAYLRVVYGRPYKRGRDNIFGTKESGALVPWGELWRTGANEATEITVTRDVTMGGQRLPAGTYTVFTTPGPENWKIHFNSALGLWGTRGYEAGKDRAVATATVGSLAEEVDQLTFAFEETEGGAELVLRWIKTEVRLPVRLAG
jgi:hypothetical protein